MFERKTSYVLFGANITILLGSLGYGLWFHNPLGFFGIPFFLLFLLFIILADL